MIPLGNGGSLPPATYPGIPKLPSSGTPVASFVPPHIGADYVPPSGPPSDYSNVPPANYVPPGGGSGYQTVAESGGSTSLGGTQTTTPSGTFGSKEMQTVLIVAAAAFVLYFVFLK